MTSGLNTTQVEAADVIRIILQFLKESNLRRSLYCLQEESGVALQCVDSLEGFKMDVMKGKWESVISVIGTMSLPNDTLFLIYEQILYELIGSNDKEAASTLLKEAIIFQSMKTQEATRFDRLENYVNSLSKEKVIIKQKELYNGSTREKRRAGVWKSLSRHIQEVPSSRLLTLLEMALKWQHNKNVPAVTQKFDLFRGVVISSDSSDIEELRVTRVARSVKFGVKTPAQCVCFSSNGRYLITGSTDGLIEIWDWTTGLLSQDFEYQNKECFMAHETAVLTLALNHDSSILVTGSSSGDIKVWNMLSGECVTKFEHVHSNAITCLTINEDNTQILTGSFDGSVRLHGLRSKSTLREFLGHKSCVTSALFYEGNRILTSSTDGTIQFWDATTTDCLLCFSPPTTNLQKTTTNMPINSIVLPHKSCILYREGSFLVCTKSTTVYLMNDMGQVLKRFSVALGETCSDFVHLAVSPKGHWIYCVTEDNSLYTFCSDKPAGTESGETLMSNIHDKDILGLASHPFDAVLATISFDGNMNILIP